MTEVVEPPVAVAHRTRARLNWRWLPIALVYFAAARAIYWHFAWLPKTQIPFSPTSDQVQQVWYFAWMAHAVSHLQNPFFTTALNYPHGVNLITNTATPLLGILFAPLTWLAGPLATFIVLLELGFALSALSAAVCARRLGAGWWSTFFVGAVFGFCAHRMVEGSDHVFLAFDVIMPWILYGAIRFWQRRWTPRRFGVVVGLLISVDFLISTERVGIELFALALIAILDLLSHRSSSRVREVLTGYALAGVLILVLLAVPLWYFFFGPQSISGAPHAHVSWSSVSFSQLVQPGDYAFFAPLGHSHSGESILQGPWNVTDYLGVPLILLAILGVWRQRRDALVRGIALLTAIFGVLALGPTITLNAIGLHVWSPYRIVAYIPGVQDILPFRFMEIVVLGLAWLAALAFTGVTVAEAKNRRSVFTWVALALATLTLVTLIPNQSMTVGMTSGTPWLATAQARDVLPENAVVLTYPYAATLFNTPMLDQAQSGLWYQLIGGQAIVPGAANKNNAGVTPLSPPLVFDVFYRAAQRHPNETINSFPFPVGAIPSAPNASTDHDFADFVSTNHVSVIFWRSWGFHGEIAKSFITAAFGPGTCYAQGSVCIWKNPHPLVMLSTTSPSRS